MYFSLFPRKGIIFSHKNQVCINRFCMSFSFDLLWWFGANFIFVPNSLGISELPQKVLLGYMCIFNDVQNEFVCKTNHIQIPRERLSCRYALEDLNQSLLSSLTLHSFLPHKFLGLMRVSSTCSRVCLSLL